LSKLLPVVNSRTTFGFDLYQKQTPNLGSYHTWSELTLFKYALRSTCVWLDDTFSLNQFIFVTNWRKLMNSILRSLVLLIFYFLSNTVFAVTKVNLNDVHICCVTCQEAIEHAVLGVKGANVTVDRDANRVAISASDDSVVQAALDAVANAGFYGKSDNDTVAIKVAAVDGKSSSAEFVGFHNCCGGCSSSLEGAVKSIAGVKTVTVSKRSCLVKGDLNAASVLKAINNAGFSASVKK
jgi:periplasmic mercuric ion binding protein